MIFTKLFIDNLYCFHKTEIDFTFERKLADSTIENEFLTYAPNFKYKKICILSGANASGKTSLARVMCGIQNFISRGELTYFIKEAAYDQSRPARIIVEFANSAKGRRNGKLNYLSLTLPQENRNLEACEIIYASTPLKKSDSNISARKRLEEIFCAEKVNRNVDKYLHIDFMHDESNALSRYRELNSIIGEMNIYWQYLFAEKQDTCTIYRAYLKNQDLKTYLQAFDATITNVVPITREDLEIGFTILWDNNDKTDILLDENEGKLVINDRLSQGTKEAVVMSTLIARIRNDGSDNVYYVDEKMAYCHSEMEKAIVNLLKEFLPDNCQLFYTTHNFDIFELNLPAHSYYVMKKINGVSEVVDIGKQFKKNDRKLINYIKNDAFRTMPDVSGVNALLMGE